MAEEEDTQLLAPKKNRSSQQELTDTEIDEIR